MTFMNKVPRRTAALQLLRGYDEHNMPVYAYVFGDKAFLEKAGENSQRLLVDISEKATVLRKGRGHKVPEGVEDEVMREFEKLIDKR